MNEYRDPKTGAVTSSHLATGGELILINTDERTARTKDQNHRNKRIENAFNKTSAPSLNWTRPKMKG